MSSGTRKSPTRAALISLAVLVLLVALTGAWQIRASSISLKEEMLTHASDVAALTAAAITAELESRLSLVEGVARRDDFASAVEARRWSDVEIFLEALRDVDPALGSSAAFDIEGRLWARHPADPRVVGKDFSHRDYFQGALAAPGPYLSEMFAQQGTPLAVVVGLSHVVRNREARPVGVLQATIPVSVLTEKVRDPTSGSVQVYDQTGHMVVGPLVDPERTFVDNAVVARVLSGEEGSGEFSLPGLEGRRLVAFAPVEDTGWGVVIEQPVSAALSPVRALTARLGGILVAVLVMASIAAAVNLRLLRRLDRERRLAETVLESIAHGVITVDPDGKVASVNPAMEQLTGRPWSELLGRDFNEVYELVDAQGRLLAHEERPMARAIRERETVASTGFDLHMAAGDKGYLPVAVAAAPILGPKGELLGGVGVIRDLSREREIDEMKSALIATVSHELRTPLTMIQGFSELLNTRDLTEQRSREALRQIQVSAERLSRLIEDLLSVSRIESGRLSIERAPVDLSELVQEVTAQLDTDGRVSVEIESPLPEVLGERDKLVQVVSNLVSNAFKYSDPDSRIWVTARGEDGGVRVEVEDEGIGMTAEQMRGLFEKFYRVDDPRVREAGGTGLGLYITKSLVEMHGGEIGVESTPGTGTKFWVTLPLDVAGKGERSREETVDRRR